MINLRLCILAYIAFSLHLATAQWTKLWEYHSRVTFDEPPKRAAHAMVMVENGFFIHGGVASTSTGSLLEYDDTWFFDLEELKWTEVGIPSAEKPASRFHHASALHANESVQEIVIFGGISVNREATQAVGSWQHTQLVQHNQVWRLALDSKVYDGSPLQWIEDVVEDGPLVPAPRSEAGIVIFENTLLMFGGISYDGFGRETPIEYNDLWIYNLSTCEWSEMMPSSRRNPSARSAHSVQIISDAHGNQYLFVFGGRKLGERKVSWEMAEDAWLYSLTSNEWISALPTTVFISRAYTSIILPPYSSTMWFFGGYSSTTGRSGSAYVHGDVSAVKLDFFASKAVHLEFSRSVLMNDGHSPLVRYDHSAGLWRNDGLVIYGGSYLKELGDVWMYNMSLAYLQKEPDVSHGSTWWTLGAAIFALLFLCAAAAMGFLLLTFLIRWRRRNRRDLDHAQARGMSIVRGLTKEKLNQLGATKYRSPRQIHVQVCDGTSDMQKMEEEEELCPICLVEFEENDDVRNLVCKHTFHLNCIDEWLQRNPTCPMCKGMVDSPTNTDRPSQHTAAAVTPLPDTS